MSHTLALPREPVLNRFLRYVQVNTQSQEGATRVPSSEGQWTLARLLADELRALGVARVEISESAIVYATIPGNSSRSTGAPPIGFIAHLDTSPAVSGAGVNPVVHRDYRGGDITLPADPSQVITVAANPALASLLGDDIVTSDGTTLLGSDDKAGIAAIMTLADTLLANPGLPHPPVALAFTPDEEIGAGIEHFDIARFGAPFAYTVDGGPLGELSDETWNARLATLTFHGRSTHPGTARGIMVNSAYAMAAFIGALPADARPESTDGRTGFLHPYAGSVDVETCTLRVLLRDFDTRGMDAKEALVRSLAADTQRQFPGVSISLAVMESYRNMREVLQHHPHLMAHAMEAARRAGVTPFVEPIRGGTDGARLTFRGLPCPNIFTGGHNFHSRLEFNSRRGLEKTTETLLHLVLLAAESAP